MTPPTDQDPPTNEDPLPRRSPLAPVRIPSRRWSAALAAATLGIGVALGAAIGPAPSVSLAGGVPSLAKELPLLLAGLEAKHRAAPAASTATTATTSEPPSTTPEPTPTPASTKAAQPASTTAPAASEEEPATTNKAGSPSTPTKKLPAITNVWLIQLSGVGFDAAAAQPAAAPYIDGTLLGAATLLSGWSAVDADAFAAEATLAEPPVAGATPPLLHSIVQPPCPEGAAGAACAPETPGELTAADTFLKATLASITATPNYTEHGLVVITFSTVGIATQSELPAGASTSTLAYQPPAGVALLSPFAKAGRSSVAYDPTSPRRSLEKLLR
jgi:hypothetical protein